MTTSTPQHNTGQVNFSEQPDSIPPERPSDTHD